MDDDMKQDGMNAPEGTEEAKPEAEEGQGEAMGDAPAA